MSEKFIMHRFESIGDFVRAAKRNARKNESSHKGERGGLYGDNWSGTKTFDEAVSGAMLGTWNPGDLLDFRDLFDGLEARLRKYTTTEFERGMDQSGFEIDMQAYLDGEPDHMMEWHPSEKMVTRRVVTLVIGHSISAGCTSKELFIRGQAAVALVRALALLGYELEIWSEETVSGWASGKGLPDYFSTLVRLHAAGEVMDETAVEFAVGNPAWLRRLLFGFQEGQPDNVRTKFGFGKGGYGSCTPIMHSDTLGASIQLDLGRRWFGEGYGSKDQTAEDGMNWVVDQLKEAGILGEEAEWEA